MNLCARLESLARYQPEVTAVETDRRTVSYCELEMLSRRIAGGLRTAGVGVNDIVGLCLRETPEHMAAFFAAMRVGAIILPIDWRSTRAEFDRLLAQFEPKVVLEDSAPARTWPRMLALDVVQQAAADGEPLADVSTVPLSYSLTSGTTGLPKAMVVTHEQSHIRFLTRAVEGIFSENDRFLNVLPLAYSAGREIAMGVILLGATLVLFPSLFRPQELIDFALSRKVSAMVVSPNVARDMLEIASDSSPLLPELRAFISTTGKLQPEERERIQKRICPRLIDYYGTTGAGAIASIAKAADGAEPTAVGRLVAGIEVTIVDDNGAILPDGTTGNIRARGSTICSHSIGAIGDQAEGFRDGWYYPGDQGRMGANGILHLDGRSADLIKRGGLMIHAMEVEQALRRHENIIDAAVVGAPSDRLGQEVVAFVVARSPMDRKEIIQHCRQELAPFKVPTRVELTAELPRKPSGKVDKNRLLL